MCLECKFFLKYVKRFTMMDTEVQKLRMQQISAFLVRGRQSHICITKQTFFCETQKKIFRLVLFCFFPPYERQKQPKHLK